MRQMCGRIAARQWSRLFSRSGDLSVRGTQAWLTHRDHHDSLLWSRQMDRNDHDDTRLTHCYFHTFILTQKSHFQRTLLPPSIFYHRLTHSLLALSWRKSTSRSNRILILKYFIIKQKKIPFASYKFYVKIGKSWPFCTGMISWSLTWMGFTRTLHQTASPTAALGRIGRACQGLMEGVVLWRNFYLKVWVRASSRVTTCWFESPRLASI